MFFVGTITTDLVGLGFSIKALNGKTHPFTRYCSAKGIDIKKDYKLVAGTSAY